MDEDRRKHLEMIQSVISRLASNSFTLKGWSVAAATALLAFAAGSKHPWVALLALLPTCVFWALDGYYLALERRYRALFRDVVTVWTTGSPPTDELPPYQMSVKGYEAVNRWAAAAWSRSVWPVHGSTLLTVAIVACAISWLPKQKDEPQRVRVEGVVPVRVAPTGNAAPPAATSRVAEPGNPAATRKDPAPGARHPAPRPP